MSNGKMMNNQLENNQKNTRRSRRRKGHRRLDYNVIRTSPSSFLRINTQKLDN